MDQVILSLLALHLHSPPIFSLMLAGPKQTDERDAPSEEIPGQLQSQNDSRRE